MSKVIDSENKHSARIGYTFGDDDIQGRAIEFEVIFLEDDEDELEVAGVGAEEVPTTGVCDTALLMCSFGSVPSPLKVTSQSGEMTNGLLDATEGDFIPLVNIFPFGNCAVNLGAPCSCPGFVKWLNVSKGNSISGMMELLNTSIINCVQGGIITIINPSSTVKKS